jgi:hypothetical protein
MNNTTITNVVVAVPGLFKDSDTVAIFRKDGLDAIALNKAIVVTSDDVFEFVPEDATYVVVNAGSMLRDKADEVVDLSDVPVADQALVAAVQSAAHMALLTCEPGPVAAKFLERLVNEPEFTARKVIKGARKMDVAVAA